MPAPSGFVYLTATRIQDATGALLAAGTLEVLPTDGNDVPITAAAGGLGGPILTTAAILTVTTGMLQALATIADTTLTLPANISYRMTTKDPQGRTISTLKGVQNVANTTLNLDTYQPNVRTQAIIISGPQGPPGPSGVGSGSQFAAVPSGTINGTNTVFTLPHTPLLLWLYKNGVFQTPGGVDYTLATATITYTTATAPVSGDSHYAQGIY